jgi:hypothetical protein
VYTSCEVHIPSTKVASFSVASAATSVCSGGVGSRTSIVQSSPTAGVLVSSPSQDKSVDFLYHTKSFGYSCKIGNPCDYLGDQQNLQSRLDNSHGRGIQNADDIYDSNHRSGLIFSPGLLWLLWHRSRGGVWPATCCADSSTTSPVVGGGLIFLLAAAPTVSDISSSPWCTGSEEGISCDNTRFNSQSIVLIGKYSSTPFAVPTSWLVISVIYNFLAARFCATLRGSSTAQEC